MLLSLFLKNLTKQTVFQRTSLNYCFSKSTIFDKILAKEIPSKKVYEDDLIYAFDDIAPQAPVHVLIIPKVKKGLNGINEANSQAHLPLLGHLLCCVPIIARIKGVQEDGYRIVINEGSNGQQTVEHLHVHLIGGRKMKWPPG